MRLTIFTLAFILTSIFQQSDLFAASAPDTIASNVQVSVRTTTSVYISCTAGSGNRRLIVIKPYGNSTSDPAASIALSSNYTGSTTYGSGSNLGNTNYCIYYGSSTGSYVTGLTPGTLYVANVYEAFQSGSVVYYNVTQAALTFSTIASEPTTGPTAGSVTGITASDATVNFTEGNGTYSIISVKSGNPRVALAFDGVDDYINVPYSSSLQPSNELTLEAWASKSNWAAISNNQTIAGNLATGGYSIYLENSDKTLRAKMRLSNNTAYTLTYPLSSISAGWHHIAMVYDQGYGFFGTYYQYVYLYVDGVSVASQTISSSSNYYNIYYTSSNNFMIGAEASTGTTPNARYFEGTIDEVRVWNTARTISTSMNNKLTSGSGLVAAWNLEDGMNYASSIAYNGVASGSAINGSLTNFSSTAMAANATNTSGWIYSKAPIDIPVDGTTYTASSTYGNGSALGTSNYVTGTTSGSTSGVSGLTASSNYTAYIYSYNGTATYNSQNYLVYNSIEVVPFATLATEPTTASSDMYVNWIDSTTARLNWQKGNGSYYLVTLRPAANTAVSPSDAASYTASPVYGTGNSLGSGNYVVYNSSSTYVDVTGLSPRTSYTATVYSFNGSATQTNYLTTLPTNASATFTTRNGNTVTNSSGLNFTNITSSSAQINYTAGTSNKRLVTIRPNTARTALAFDGTNDYVSLANESRYDFTGAYTIETWFYLNPAVNSSEALISKGVNAWGLHRYSTTDYLQFDYYKQNGSVVSMYSNKTYRDGNWHHIAIVWDGSYLKMYVDGAIDASTTVSGGSTTPGTNNNNIYIGSEPGSASATNFSGMLDQVRIWNKSFADAEIRARKDVKGSVTEYGLLSYFDFDEGTTGGTTLNNLLGPLNGDGTLMNFASTAAATNFTSTSGWVQSKVQVAAPFDGASYTSSQALGYAPVLDDYERTIYSSTGTSVYTYLLSPGTLYNVSVYDANVLPTAAYNNYDTYNYLTGSFTTVADTAPVITSFSPAFASPGSEVTINGSNFGAYDYYTTVYFGTVKATITSMSSTQIKVIVPAGALNDFIKVYKYSGLMGQSSTKFILSADCAAGLNATSFGNGYTISGINYPLDFSIADLDDNKFQDIVASEFYDAGIAAYGNTSSTGTMGFGSKYQFSADQNNSYNYTYGVDAGDVDGDGKLDVLSSQYYANSISFLKAKSGAGAVGTSYFETPPTNFQALSYTSRPRMADLNKDGKLDVMAGSNSAKFSVFSGQSTKSSIQLSDRMDSTLSYSSDRYSYVDFDSDGDLDIIIANTSSTNTTVIKNTSVAGGAYTYQVTAGPTIAATINNIEVADLNNDNKPDLIAAVSTGIIYFYKNTSTSGTISFASSDTLKVKNRNPMGIRTADFTGDGRPDLVVGYSSTDSIGIFTNVTTGTPILFNTGFHYKVGSGSFGSTSILNVADMNNDGLQDVIVSNTYSEIQIMKNNMQAIAAEPVTSASSISTTNITTTTADISFTAGNGTGRMVIVYETEPLSSTLAGPPVDGVNYVANASFGLGDQFGSNAYVVYNGNSNSVSITNLQSDTYYEYYIIEYNGTACTSNYQYTTTAYGSFKTLNVSPTINVISNPAAICQDLGLQTVNLSGLGTGGESHQSIEITAISSNTSIIPNPTVDYTAGSSTTTLSYTPVAGASGNATITVTVTDYADDNSTTVETFLVRVKASPTAALAGSDITICSSQINLNANTPTSGTGQWTILSSTNGAIFINDPSSATAVISGFNVNDSVMVKWTISNSPCDASIDTVKVKRNSCPLTADFIASGTNFCLATGDSVAVTFTDNSENSGTIIDSYTWNFGSGAVPATYIGMTPPVVKYITPGLKTVQLSITNTIPNSDTEVKTDFINISSYPSTPASITGVTSACQGETNVPFSITSVANATGYDWLFPSGLSFASGQGNSNIGLNVSDTATLGYVQVRGVNACGNGPYSPVSSFAINNLPVAATVVSGSSQICEGVQTTYTIPVIDNATSYSWNIPSGFSVTGAINSSSITLIAQAATTTGNLSVMGVNSCGLGAVSAAFDIVVNAIPEAATSITGLDLITQCPVATGIQYSVSSINGANNYTWSVPSGSVIAFGDGTESIVVDYGFSAISGAVSVFGSNGCGVGVASDLSITVDRLPGTPISITGLDSIGICPLTGVEVYTTPVVTNADYYLWTIPSGATIVSGDSTNSVAVDYSAVTGSGNVSVTAYNACGNGGSAGLPVVLDTLPIQNICLLTIDSMNNIVTVWEKPLTQGSLAGYNIYRENNIANQFDYVITVPYDSLSEYVDTAASVNPDSRTYRYKIAAIDSCGNESVLSDYHQTIHIAVAKNISLVGVDITITDGYYGLNFGSYNIYRTINDTTILLTTIPSNINGYTDLALPGYLADTDTLYYFVTIEGNISCTAERGKNYNAVKSNTANLRTGIVTSKEWVDLSSSVKVYPNPSSGVLYINSVEHVSVSVVSVLGSEVINQTIGSGKTALDVKDLAAGSYFIVIKGEHINKTEHWILAK